MSTVVHVVCIMLAASTAFASEAPERRRAARGAVPSARIPEGVVAHRDLAYVDRGHARQKLDLYLPEKADSPLPLIIWIHGGGWAAGSKDNCQPLRQGYIERGYAVASIGYRLSGDAIFPAQIEDCKAAIRWLRAHAAQYHLDPDRFGVWGSSAGGHLVALLGTSGDVKEFDVGSNLDQSSRVQAVCDYFGPTDLLQMDAHALPSARLKHDPVGSPESRLIGGAIQENKDKVRRANPITYVSNDDPQFLIVHGDQDPTVPHHQSQLLFQALKKAGVSVRFHTIHGAGHGQGFGGREIEEMVNGFFDRSLKSDEPGPVTAIQTESDATDGAQAGAPPTGRGPGLTWEQVRAREGVSADGRVTRDQFKGPRPFFNRLDRNGDGVLTKEDFDGTTPAARAPAGERKKAADESGNDRGPSTAAAPRSKLPTPTHANVAYGSHQRNVLDFWQAKSDRPTPLAIFVHGGGFIGGSKEQLNPRELQELLDGGISVAALNYRLLSQAPLPAAHQDVARAVQFLRSKAAEWNLDKTRFGGFGGSAGAQLVMYLAFHDDLADPKSTDPVARESSRLSCVASGGGQITMDMKWWDANVPGYAAKATRRRSNAELFGTTDESTALKTNAEISAIALISRGDPPVFLSYGMAPEDDAPAGEEAMGWMIHHVVHGQELKKLCDRLGVEAHLTYPGAQSRYKSAVEFLKAKLVTRAADDAENRSTPRAEPGTTGRRAASPPAAWAEPKVEPEGMAYRTFPSKAAGTDVSYVIYLPPDYETATDRRYPVVYWLHGRGGSQTGASQLVQRLDAAIRAGKALPMIVVGVNGLRTSSFVDSADGKFPVQTVIAEELIPHIDATYRTIATREGRGIEGFSMGGAGAPKIGFKYPELFGAVSILAGALHDLESYKSRGTAFQDIYGGRDDYFEANSPWKLVEKNADTIRRGTTVRIVVGGKDGLLARNTAFHELLDKLGIKHDFTVVEGAPHSPGPLYDGVGDQTWAFYAKAFGTAESAEAATANGRTP
ncbi:MAG: alpha/beta hydrolase fold domain-containing protein [Planctomycetota bacterium]